MRLCNPKTKSETGFDHVVHSLIPRSPYGKKRVKEIRPFAPGEEELLEQELSRQESAMRLIKNEGRRMELLSEILMQMKDTSFTVERTKNNVLTMVELFEMKTLLLQMLGIRDLLSPLKDSIPEEFFPQDVEEVVDVLDPDRERMNTFYLYDSFSQKLAELRGEKRRIELEVRREQKDRKREVEQRYGISMTPKFEYLVSKADKDQMEAAQAMPELALQEEDYMTATFRLRGTPTVHVLCKKMDTLNEALEDEELLVRETLSQRLGSHRDVLLENSRRIGELDFNLAKAMHAEQNRCVRPRIVQEHILEVKEGRQLVVEEILNKKGKDYCPVTLSLKDGVACITGANMGGKTVTLKMIGQCAMLAQHGFFVPCQEATIGLSSYIHILIGDSQNVQRGLSSFGSEMEELKDILEHSKDRTLLLIDEIANGTNPIEGLALTKSIVHYLSKRLYITLITTHYDNVATEDNSRNLQVQGLAGANFENLAREIRYANRRERIEIIGKYMDYRLYEVEGEKEIPKDALNIAKMLGIGNEIIEQAKRYMEDRNDEK